MSLNDIFQTIPQPKEDEVKQRQQMVVWAKLIPLLTTCEPVELKKAETKFGRAPVCDVYSGASEISGVHCLIFRVRKYLYQTKMRTQFTQ